jgi:hypothetical protein
MMHRIFAVVVATVLASLLLSCGGNPVESPPGEPVSVFVVHCEPGNASLYHYLNLVELVGLADQHNIRLTILLTSQWAQMIASDPTKLDDVEGWVSSGHEIGCHHHPYWMSLTVPAGWDGYTDTPYEDILPEYQPFYQGDMTDYWAPFDSLPEAPVTGCFGCAEEDEIDWFEWLTYSTHGNTLEHAVSQPYTVDFAGDEATEIGHGQIYGQDMDVVEDTYLDTTEEYLFGIVVHVYNFDEDSLPATSWFQFLYDRDEQGEYRKTVSEAIEEYGSN